jgi:DNA-binding PadR family transcriptional regulator
VAAVADGDVPAHEDISPGEYCLLALLSERQSHGWSLATTLSRDGEIGSIWSVARPLVYTGLRRLETEGMIVTTGLERGQRGPHRVIYGPTPEGRKAVREWLLRPVEHVREIRSLFLLKVVLAQRLGLDTKPLLVAQRELMTPFVAWLEARLDDVDPALEPTEATVLYFRLETAQTTVRFIDHMLAAAKANGGKSKRASK